MENTKRKRGKRNLQTQRKWKIQKEEGNNIIGRYESLYIVFVFFDSPSSSSISPVLMECAHREVIS